MLPNFLVIGAMKAGTSSLYRYLRDHPQIFMPDMKEPQFFAKNWGRGLDWYEGLFEGARDACAIGEASTDYTKYPEYAGVPPRISQLLPNVRMIYLVRDPIERMISDYQHRVGSRQGWERRRSIEEALLENPSYCHGSQYAMQIEHYLEYFPRDRLLVLKSEELKDQREQTLRRVFGFLGVDERWQPPNLRQEFHKGSEQPHHRPIDRALRKAPGYRALASIAPLSLKKIKYRWTTKASPPKPTLSPAVLLELRSRLQDDVRQMRRYLGEDFDGWGIA